MPAKGLTLIIGAGPAGLSAGYELSKLGLPAMIVEQDEVVGGLARTINHNEFYFDIGGHRFFTKSELVQSMWRELLGDDLLLRPRKSRIYYRNRFYDYPIKPLNTLRNIGSLEAARILASYLRARLFPIRGTTSFEQWVSNRFGRRLFSIFFKTYTEKVWGMPCSQISADWASQRIKDFDLDVALKHALFGGVLRGKRTIATLIEQFYYPRLGPGMMWERCQSVLQSRGIETRLQQRVRKLHMHGGRVAAVTVLRADGSECSYDVEHVISSMPLRELLHAFEPSAPDELQRAAQTLTYRDFMTVVLRVDKADIFPDNWIYVHAPEVKVARIQNFKNWSPSMLPNGSQSSLGLEYFVQEDDELWRLPDHELVALGSAECARLGLIDRREVIDGMVVRMPKAYPVYHHDYQKTVLELKKWLDRIENLATIGRNGQHRYNNQDHSMLTGIYAARRVAGLDCDPWKVNLESDYYESFS